MEKIQPDLRIAFKSTLSFNDVNVEKWAKGETVAFWEKLGQTKAVEACKLLGVPIETYEEIEEKGYQGTKEHLKGTKRKIIKRGERLKDYFFEEPIAVVIRLWKSNKRRYDIPNLMEKAILDGFTQAKIYPDDNTDYVRWVCKGFMDIDTSLRLDHFEQEERKKFLASVRNPRLYPPNDKRVYYDFWNLERFWENLEYIFSDLEK